MNASSGVAPGRGAHHLQHVREHEHCDVRKEVVLLHVEQAVVVEIGEPLVAGLDPTRPDDLGDRVAHRATRGDGGCRTRVALRGVADAHAHDLDEGLPDLLVVGPFSEPR